jgi:spermidine/putrescine transport system permease protein
VNGRVGLWAALPMLTVLAVLFIGPQLVVLGYSLTPSGSFVLGQSPTLENFVSFFEAGYYRSLLVSLELAAITTLALLLLCYPLAFAMAKIFGRFSPVIVVGVALTLFVSENIRMLGWVLVFMKGGLLPGSLHAYLGVTMASPLYTGFATVFGMIYGYLPFMLFPLSLGIAMVPDEVRHAARDLGAGSWTVVREVDLPLAMPGILVGALLTFVLCTGATLESKLLGGKKLIVMADEIETAFTFGQNWPLGSAFAMVMILIVAALAVLALRRVDLDSILKRT